MKHLINLAASFLLFFAFTGACAAATKLPPKPSELFITDSKTFKAEDIAAFRKMLSEFKERTGVTLYFVVWSDPYDISMPDGSFAILLAKRWGMYENNEKTVILVRGGIHVSCYSSKDIGDSLDYGRVEYLKAKFISPLRRPKKVAYAKFKRMLVGRLKDALVDIELFLTPKRPKRYLLWIFFEASPSSSIFQGLGYYLIIAARYLFALLCLVPTLFLYLFIITKLAQRQVVSADYFPLIELAVMGVLITLQVALGFLVDYGSLRAIFLYVGAGGMLFLFSAPLHLILFRQMMSDEAGWPKWVFVILYIIFPLAVFVAGSALAGNTRIRYRTVSKPTRGEEEAPSTGSLELEKADSD